MPVSQEHIDYVVSLYSCFNDNTLGKKNALRKLNDIPGKRIGTLIIF